MKNKLIFVGMLSVILVFGIMALGCKEASDGGGSGDSGSIASELRGTWVLEQNPASFSLEIGKNDIVFGGTTGEMAGAAYSAYDWRAKNGKIEGGISGTWTKIFDYEIDGDTLTLKMYGMTAYVLIKE